MTICHRIRRYLIVVACLLSLLLGVGFAQGATYIRESFSTMMKRVELIFIGTVVEKEIIREGTTGLHTDLTLHVDQLIEGTPNIDNNTVKFRVPGQVDHSSPGTPEQTYRQLEVGDTLMMLMNVNKYVAIRYGWLYPVSSWFVKSEKVEKETEYTVYIWANTKETLERHYLGLPLPLMVRFIDAARKHPEIIDPVTDVLEYGLVMGTHGGIPPDSPKAERIRQGIITYIEIVLDALETAE